jgi:hypothetical protein
MKMIIKITAPYHLRETAEAMAESYINRKQYVNSCIPILVIDKDSDVLYIKTEFRLFRIPPGS